MKVSVLVLNYNYSHYVCDAIRSALDQTHEPDEVIVVDDGSTDNSSEVLRQDFNSNSKVKLVFKMNEGQVTAFNEAYINASGDVLFFLDADDVYKPDYIKNALTAFSQRPDVDFVSSSYEFFGKKSGVEKLVDENRCLGYSVIRAYKGRRWLGGATSMNAIRRSFAQKLFPLPVHCFEGLKSHADLALVLGSSVLGAKKYALAEPYVCYRSHGGNYDLDRKHDNSFDYQIKIITSRILEYYWQLSALDLGFINNLWTEFDSIENPSRSDKKDYAKLVRLTDFSLFKKLELLKRIYFS